jgi:peptide deformylase
MNYLKLLVSSGFLFLFNTLSYGANQEMTDQKKSQNEEQIIVQVGDPVLRQVAKPLTQEEILSPAIQELIILMKNKMREAPGVGLAAPQIGVPLQIAVIEDREEYTERLTPVEIAERDRYPVPFHVIINPVITIVEPEKQATFYEGCLSLAGFVGRVSRALHVKVDALNEHGLPIHIDARGWYARILQHEVGHLNGALYIDHMDTRSFATVENYQKFQ